MKRFTDMVDPPGSFHNHLGPDGFLDYTHSIGECIAASWDSYARLTTTPESLTVVATTDAGVVDICERDPVGAVAYWDPFAPASGDAPQSRPFSWDNSVSAFLPLGFVSAYLDSYWKHR